MQITKVHARQILDSKGDPTVEVEVSLGSDISAIAAVPAGSSAGTHEAFELRDGDKAKFNSRGVLRAVSNINNIIAPALLNLDPTDQRSIDSRMIELDGTVNKSRLGANAILGVSMAICKAAASSNNQQLFSYIADLFGNKKIFLPRPMVLFLEGGKHGNWSTDLQEFMLMPSEGRFENFVDLLDANVKIFRSLEKILAEKKYSVGLGFEGAFCPQEISSNEEALELLVEATKEAGFECGRDFVLAVDAAASEFFSDDKYILKSENNKVYTPKEWTDKIIKLTQKYPIFSLEDIHHEDAWEQWVYLTSQLAKDHQVVGDDLVTTNIERIEQAISKKAINAVIIKLNQIGTVSETMDAVALTQKAGWVSVVSHRGGETNDDFIADFCVGTGSQQCKFGGVNRGERVAKYNRLNFIWEKING